MIQNIIEASMYDIVGNYSANVAEHHWDIRNDEDYSEFDLHESFRDVASLVCKTTATQTLRRMFKQGYTTMLLDDIHMMKLEAWERDNAQWLIFVYESLKFDNTTPLVVLTKNDVQW
jgi:hypothetical protein